MTVHLSTGRAGEDLAAQYLLQRGWQILERNWRSRHWELDIIASDQQVLHFVEVKTKRSLLYGHPEGQVRRDKLRFLARAAEQYLLRHPGWKRIQFDVVAVTLLPGREPELLLIEDVFY